MTNQTEIVTVMGTLHWELFRRGRLLRSGACPNLITQVGCQMYWERGAGIAGAPAVPTGMKLGTGSTAPTPTGAGAALATYLANSQQGFDSGFPASTLLAAISLSAVTAAAATDLFTSTAHGLVNDRPVTLASPPAGLTAGVVYYVVSATANTFGLATAPGGSLVNVTADGTGITVTAPAVRRVTYKVTYAAGKATSAASAISEAALVNETLTDATSAAAATVARNLPAGLGTKGDFDTLALTWNHDLKQPT
jgi:hypothetical protein